MNRHLTRRRFLAGLTASAATLLTASTAFATPDGSGWANRRRRNFQSQGLEKLDFKPENSHDLRDGPQSEENVSDVRSFGAIGDGHADDTHALTEALNSASPGGFVYLPAGIYRTTRTISIPDNVTVAGAGRDATTIRYTGDGRIFHIVERTRTAFEDLEIQGNPEPPYWGYGIDLERSNQFAIRRCRLRDVYEHAVYLHAAEGVVIEDTEFLNIGLTGVRLAPTGNYASNRDITIRNCQFHSVVTRMFDGNSAVHAHGNPDSPTNNEHITIESCFVDSHRIGIGLDDVAHAVVRDCRITGHLEWGEGIAVSGSHNLIEHNQINNFVAAGVLIWGINWKPNASNVVRNNEIWDCAQGIAIATWYPGSAFEGIEIRGNRCYRANGTGTNGWGDMAFGVQTYIDTNPETGQQVTDFSARDIEVIANDLRGNRVGPYSFVEPYLSATRFVENAP